MKLSASLGGNGYQFLSKGSSSMSSTQEVPINISLCMYWMWHISFMIKWLKKSYINPRSLFPFLIHVNTTAFDLREQLSFDLQELISVNPTEPWGNEKQQFGHPEIRALHPAGESTWLASQLLSSNYEPTLGATRLAHWCYNSHGARIQLRGWLAIKSYMLWENMAEIQGEGLTEAADTAKGTITRVAGVVSPETYEDGWWWGNRGVKIDFLLS